MIKYWKIDVHTVDSAGLKTDRKMDHRSEGGEVAVGYWDSPHNTTTLNYSSNTYLVIRPTRRRRAPERYSFWMPHFWIYPNRFFFLRKILVTYTTWPSYTFRVTRKSSEDQVFIKNKLVILNLIIPYLLIFSNLFNFHGKMQISLSQK